MQKGNLVLDQHQARNVSSVSITHMEFSRNPRNSWKATYFMDWARTDPFPSFTWFIKPPSALGSFRGWLWNRNCKIHNITSFWVVRSWLGSSWVTVLPSGFFWLLLPEFWPFRCTLALSLEGGEQEGEKVLFAYSSHQKLKEQQGLQD